MKFGVLWLLSSVEGIGENYTDKVPAKMAFGPGERDLFLYTFRRDTDLNKTVKRLKDNDGTGFVSRGGTVRHLDWSMPSTHECIVDMEERDPGDDGDEVIYTVGDDPQQYVMTYRKGQNQ